MSPKVRTALLASALTALATPAMSADQASAQIALGLEVPVVCRLDTLAQGATDALVHQMCNTPRGFTVYAYHDPLAGGAVTFDYDGVRTVASASGVTEIYTAPGASNVDATVTVTGTELALVRLVIEPNQ